MTDRLSKAVDLGRVLHVALIFVLLIVSFLLLFLLVAVLYYLNIGQQLMAHL